MASGRGTISQEKKRSKRNAPVPRQRKEKGCKRKEKERDINGQENQYPQKKQEI